VVENCRLQHCQLTHTYCLQCLRPANIDVSVYVIFAWKSKMVISREDRMLIKILHQPSRLWDLGPATGACLPLKNLWRQPLDGATDRGVVRSGSQHHLCGSESVAYASASLLMEGTLNISSNSNSNSNRYLSFELILTVFIVLETFVFSVSS